MVRYSIAELSIVIRVIEMKYIIGFNIGDNYDVPTLDIRRIKVTRVLVPFWSFVLPLSTGSTVMYYVELRTTESYRANNKRSCR